MKEFDLKKPSNIIKIKNNTDRNSTLNLYLEQTRKLIKQYRAHTTNTIRSNDEKKLESCNYITEQLRNSKTTLQHITQIPKYRSSCQGTGLQSDSNKLVRTIKLINFFKRSWK